MTLVTKTNMVTKPSGNYFYTYIPSEIVQKLGLKKGQEHLIWNLFGSRAEIMTLPIDVVKKILEDYQPKVVSQIAATPKKSPRIFIKNGRATDEDLI